MANFEEIRGMAYSSYEKVMTASKQLSVARTQEQQAQANVYAAEYAYSMAVQQANSISNEDDENGYARQAAMAAVSQASAQLNAARAMLNSVRHQIQISIQQLQSCRNEFRRYTQLCGTELQKLEAALLKTSELSGHRYDVSKILDTIKSQKAKYSKLSNTCQQCIQFIDQVLNDGGDNPERILEKGRDR